MFNSINSIFVIYWSKDYKRHAALDRFVNIPDYNIKEGIVLSNDGKIESVGKILYLPIYFCMFLNGSGNPESLFIWQTGFLQPQTTSNNHIIGLSTISLGNK